MCLIVGDYVYLCVVLFVMSKILDSSRLLSCPLEMGVEYYLVCTSKYQKRTAVWEGCGATARPREAEWSSGVAALFCVYYKNVFKDPFGHHYCCY